jgi:hypothetical protein
MTPSIAVTTGHPRRLLRSIVAVVSGFIAVFVLSLGADQILHVLKVYPPWGEPMRATSLNLLALSYRIPFDILGSYVTARLAPYSPMRHVWVGAGIGLALSTAGVIAAMSMDLGPVWYPVLLALSTVPCAWLGGVLYVRRRTKS